jgi:hypothetical protein
MNKRQKAEGSQPEPVPGSPSTGTVESLLGLSHPPPPLYSQVERSASTLDEASPVTSRKRKRNDTRSRREKSDSEANDEPSRTAASQDYSHARSSGRVRDDSVSCQVATVVPRLIRTKTLSVDIGKADCVPSSVLAKAFPSRNSDTWAQVTDVSSRKRVPNSQATEDISPSVRAESSSQCSEGKALHSEENSCTNKHALADGSTTVTNTVDPDHVSQNSDLSVHKVKTSISELNPMTSDIRPLRSEKGLVGDRTGCGLEPKTVAADKYAVGPGDLGVLLADIGRLKALLVDDKESRRVDCLPVINRNRSTGEPRQKDKGKSSRRSERGSSGSENALVDDRNLCRSEPESSTSSIILSESVSKSDASDLLSSTNDLTSDKALPVLSKPSAQSTPKSSRRSDSCALSAETSALLTGDASSLRSEIKKPETIVRQKNDQRLHESQPSLSTTDTLNPRHDPTDSPAGSERLNRSSNRADGQPEDGSNYWPSNLLANQTESSPRAADSKSLSQAGPSPKTVELRPRLADSHGGERVESCTGASDSGETIQPGFKIAELGCETITELNILAEIRETSTQHLPNISESRAESPEDSNHVPHRPEVVCGLSSQEGVEPFSRLSANTLSPLSKSEPFPVVPAVAVTHNTNEICKEKSASNENITERPMSVDLLSDEGNTGASGGECLVVTRDSIQPVTGTATSGIINFDVVESYGSKMETLDPQRSIEFGKLGDTSEQAVAAPAPELKTASTTCRIRVRQDMFQDPKEEPIRACPVEEPIQDLVKEREEEEQDQVDRDRWAVEEDKKWLKRSVRDEDVLDTAGARSPPPRTLSRRLDYRRQRRHQWRSPVDGASPRQGALSGVPPAKPKSGGQELITLNLNTESLDPEPPGLLLSDWQLSIQPLTALSSSPVVTSSSSSCQLVVTPLMTSSSQLMMTSPSSQAVMGSNYLSHKLKLRQPRVGPAQETSGGRESSSASCSLPQGKRLFFYKFSQCKFPQYRRDRTCPADLRS